MKKMVNTYSRCLLSVCLVLSSLHLRAQDRTLGVILNDSLSIEGYTLIATNSSLFTYLIDNCGHVVNTWESEQNTGLSAYLIPDGKLLRTARISNNFSAGGSGGRIERYAWDGSLEWRYDYVGADHCQHHDIEPLPDGNVLVLSWDRVSREEALLQGRDSVLLGNDLWSEQIVELKPIGQDSAEIVWRWRAWDHLVQDYDPTRANYGALADNPHKLDVNTRASSQEDWIHFNGIDYIEEYDQILITSRHLWEIYIIDHALTTEEAQTDTAGRYGLGGDILYRWGMNDNYGYIGDRRLAAPHSAIWNSATDDRPAEIAVFNNRGFTTGSEAIFMQPPLLVDGSYHRADSSPWGPELPSWSTDDIPEADFFSPFMGAVDVLQGENMLVCSTTDGQIFEFTRSGELVWQYHNPVIETPQRQGTDRRGQAFRVDRYIADGPELSGQDLTPGELLELDPLPEECRLYDIILHTTEIPASDLSVYPTLVEDYLRIESVAPVDLQIYDHYGRLLYTLHDITQKSINLSDYTSGMYYLYFHGPSGLRTEKVILR